MKAVGVDLGATNARAALVEVESGKILAETKAPWTNRAPETVAAIVGRGGARGRSGRTSASASASASPACCAAGRAWSSIAPNFGWREVDFRTMLRAEVGERCELYNDLNAIAYGEATYGGARGVRDVLCVYVGTGVGAGIVVDGRLYAGATHLGGEIGHTKVVPGGRLCGCGMRGCLEAYTSGRNIQKRAQEELRRGERSLAVELAGGIDHVHAGFLDEAARARRRLRRAAVGRGLDAARHGAGQRGHAHQPVAAGHGRRRVAGRARAARGARWRGCSSSSTSRRAKASRSVDTALGDTAGMLGVGGAHRRKEARREEASSSSSICRRPTRTWRRRR